MADSSVPCPHLTGKGKPCKGLVPAGKEACRVHDLESGWHCKREDCLFPAKRGADGLCALHSDPIGTKEKQLRGHVSQAEQKQRRVPPRSFYEDGWAETEIFNRPQALPKLVERYDVSKVTVRRWFSHVDYVNAQKRLQEFLDEHGPEPTADMKLPVNIKKLGAEHLDFLVDDFIEFRGKYFLADIDEPYVTPPFQRRWARAIFSALVLKNRQVILSPPRHGKTDLLIHICVYLICHWPNVRILWIAGNERIATRSVAQVQGILESNEALINKFAPVGGFRPAQRGGKKWSRTEFAVETQTLSGGKRLTMTAIGRGGNTRSIDADIVVADDIEDHAATAQPGSREGTREWWTMEAESRKMAHTGLFVITSRVHPDDLAGKLLENDIYEHIVEHAHDPECAKDPKDYDVHVGCMLFPDLVPYQHLMGLKKAAETTGGPAYFQMVYQNMPSVEGLQAFPPELVDSCKDPTYSVGQIPPGASLVAGLDPAASGFQACFLWAYKVERPEGEPPKLRMWMVDTQNNLGGGIGEARKSVELWWEKYKVDQWVVEKNLFHGGIVDDELLKQYRYARGIQMESFETYRNKVDPLLGVTDLATKMRQGVITLPYSEINDSQEKTDAYRAQLIYWDAGAPRNRNSKAGYKSDLVMASWFPMDLIRREKMDYDAEAGADFGDYPGSDWGLPPWDEMIA